MLIDGRRVVKPTRFFTGPQGSESPIFNVQLPPGQVFGALFGVPDEAIPDLALSPSAEQGYYLFVRRLPPGPHTIHWTASGCSSPDFSLDITYLIDVADDEE